MKLSLSLPKQGSNNAKYGSIESDGRKETQEEKETKINATLFLRFR